MVREKYVGLPISSAPVPRCGNRFSDRPRKSEGVLYGEREVGAGQVPRE